MSLAPTRPASLTLAQIRRLEPKQTSALPGFLKRLSWIVALVLGGGSLVAAVCSRLLLPLLWSTYSARQAITDQQLVGFKQIVAGLRAIRGRKFFRATPRSEVSPKKESVPGDSGSDRDTVRESRLADSLLIEDMSDGGRADLDTKMASEREPLLEVEKNTFLHFRSDLEELPSLLDALGTNLSATSTTRTSLLSTLASYNSQLHTQDFVSNTRGGRSRGGVGLNSLDENLAKEAGRSGARGLDGGDTSEEFVIGRAAPEFEELRKEVRGLKGLLLSRRNFASVSRN